MSAVCWIKGLVVARDIIEEFEESDVERAGEFARRSSGGLAANVVGWGWSRGCAEGLHRTVWGSWNFSRNPKRREPMLAGGSGHRVS